ncbi:MAG: hypothetical protein WBB67_05895 [bacterium]
MGYIAVDIFSDDVDSPDHPSVQDFRRILNEIAISYKCSLTDFIIDHGVVIFRFDNNEITMDILEDLRKATGVKATAWGGNAIDIEKIKWLLKKPKQNE